MENYNRYAVGMDISDRDAKVYVESPDGKPHEETTVPLDRTVLTVYLKHVLKLNPVIAFEVGAHSNWLYDVVVELGFKDIYVANPREVKLITKSRKKTDRVDARKLARLARVDPGLLASTQPRGTQARLDRSLISSRATAVRTRTKLINHVRGVVKAVGERLSDCQAARFHQLEAALPEPLTVALGPLMQVIKSLTDTIKAYDATIQQRGSAHPVASRLEKAGGIGFITALSYVSCIEDPKRFKKVRTVGSFLGLVPKVDESGSIEKQLSITKAGDPYLRSLLVSSAHTILKQTAKDSDLKRWGRALMERGGKNARKRAAIAVARKLAVMLLSMWKSGEEYRAFKDSPAEPLASPPRKPKTRRKTSQPVRTSAVAAA